MARLTLPFPARLAALLAALAATPTRAQQAEPAQQTDRSEVPALEVPALEPPEAGRKPAHTPDVVYVPTPERVVAAMLDLARVGEGDVVYDLGCGDGRIVVAAARRGARKAVGVDIDPERVTEARANVRKAGVADRAQIREGDLFELDLSDATVVTLYLLPDLNLRLRPKLLALRPGTRVVSHAFDMGDWKPDRVLQVDGKTVYSWTVPARGKAQARTVR